MKKFYLIFSLALALMNQGYAQTWMPVGPSDINQPSYYQASYNAMAVGPDGSVYAAYIDAQNQNRVTVSRFNAGNWSIVGDPGFSADNVQYLDIAVGGDGIPYVIYQTPDPGDNFAYRATVMSYSSGTWSNVGPANVYRQAAFNNLGFAYWPGIDIAVGPAPDYDPYIAYQDYDFATYPIAGTVRRFDGTNWVLVGNQGFTYTLSGGSQAPQLVLDIAPNGVPYMVYLDNSGSGGNEMSAARFNGTAWELVGSAGFTTPNFSFPAMDFSGGDFAVYVAYRDNVNLNETSVMRFDGSNWSVVGTAGFSNVNSDNISLAVTPGGTPYVAYRETITNRARVQVFDGSSWNDATPGEPDVSDDAVNYIRLVMGSGNIPYIIYQDIAANQKAVVKSLTGGEWIAVGNNGFSEGPANFTSAASGNDGSFYVAYSDGSNGNRATVKKYSGGTWTAIPSSIDVGFTGGTAEYLSLAINPVDGNAYVALRDGANGNEVSVYVEAPDGWGLVGAPAFSSGSVTFTSLAFNSTGVPYVAFADAANGNEVTVMSYNGANWVNVGTAGFSNSGAVSYVSLDIAPDGTPYVAYQSAGLSDEISVRRFQGGNWNLVGTDGFSTGVANYIDLSIHSSGVPYVAYQDGNGGGATVQMFDGSTWVTVGSAGFSAGAATYLSLEFDPSGNPVAAYQDGANGDRLSIQSFTGGLWSVVGSSGISAGTANDVSLAINSAGGLYVAYSDGHAWAQVFETGVLPVILSDFTVSKLGNNSLLKWQTTSELNSSHFIVEHSINGVDFSQIGRVSAAGNSDHTNNYSYQHHFPVQGINYYRLKQVDIDGRTTRFPVRKINFSFEQNMITVHPNPVKDVLRIKTNMTRINEVVITSATGQKVYQKQIHLGSVPEVNVSSLPNGVYILSVSDGNSVTSTRFVKN